MAFFTPEFLQDVMDRNDIVDTIGRSIELKGVGNNFKGLCPFHNEKTPSFSVSRDKQLFHCFGCGKGGTVISFIMERDGLDFVEAVKYLAEAAGMEIPEGRYQSSGIKADLRQELYQINIEAAKFFRDKLYEPIGKAALEYANGRGLDKRVLDRFGIGYAPNGKEILEHLRGMGFSDEKLRLAGVTAEGERGDYLRFRDRLMFPIIDLRKNVIGFGGRALGRDVSPKYINTAQTPIYNKGQNLFALNIAKNSKASYLILVEGYMDVIALHQVGIDSAIASLGTAFTEQQARVIKRYRDEVIISYDSDEAGQAAAKKATELLIAAGIKTRILVQNTECKDPDDYIKKYGVGAFRELIQNAPTAIEYITSKIKGTYDLGTTDGKVAYIKALATELAKLDSEVEREIYGRRAAEDAGVSVDAVFAEIKKEKVRLESSGQTRRTDLGMEKKLIRRGMDAQKMLLSLMAKDITLVDMVRNEVSEGEFHGEIWQKLAENFYVGKTAQEIAAMPEFVEVMHEISEVIYGDETIEDVKLAASELIGKIKRENRRREMLAAANEGDLQKIGDLINS